ncbi:MAG: hypothetical protein BGO31_18815 [Bacteroidetes bacterium 43-16]|nr:MAG: hypothetical protein BGO31_18815 [Bacteroidetes bacterium 43-16]
MKKAILILVSSITIFSGSSSGQAKNYPIELSHEIMEIDKQRIFNGFSVSIVNEKGTLYQKGFGFSEVLRKKKYTENTIQNIASVSKTFVGIALLKAQELGQLNLDEPVDKYLPFKVFNPGFPNEKITLRQLATHTSSITDNEFYLSKNYYLKANQDLGNVTLNFDEEQIFNPSDSILSLESFLKNILSANGKWHQNSFSKHKPGTIYEYSNIGTALAAYIIEQATNESFSNFTKKHILQPLKMNHSGWKFEDIRFSNFSRLYSNPKTPLPYYEMITFPDGGFITSVNDLSKFLSELIRGYNGRGTILSKKSYKEYFLPQLSASNFTERNEQNPYSESYNTGIFIGFGYTGYIGHTGGDPGVVSMMFFDPKSNIGRIMIFNTNFSDKKGNDAFYSIWNLLEKYQRKFEK